MLRAIVPLAANTRLRIFNDNQSVVGMLSKLTTSSSRCLPLIKEIVGLLVVYNVSLVVLWCDTHTNRHADILSRWHDPSESKSALLRELRQLRQAKPRR